MGSKMRAGLPHQLLDPAKHDSPLLEGRVD